VPAPARASRRNGRRERAFHKPDRFRDANVARLLLECEALHSEFSGA